MASSHLKLHLQLGEDFVSTLQKVMEDELEVAAQKWGYRPTAAERREVLRHGFDQVTLRMRSVSNNPSWAMSETITFSMPGPKIEMQVPSDEATASGYQLIRSRDGWLIDQDRTEDSVPLNDFLERFTREVQAWARTSVFYSIGSYKS